MSGISNLWMLSAVVTPAGQISQIVSQTLDPQIEHIMEGASGNVDAEFAAINESKPMLSFTTTAIKSALQIAGLDAYAITGNTDFYFRKIAQGGLRDNANSIKVTVAKGIILPRRLSASHGDKQGAKLTYELHAISIDGVTAPLTVATGQALPTINPISELFTIGPVGLNSGSLAAIDSLEYDFGFTQKIVGSDGNAYPTFAGISTRRSLITVGGFDMTAHSTFGMNGLALTSWKTYLRAHQAGGTRYSDGSSQHVKLFGTNAMFRPETTQGTDQQELSGKWCIHPVYDGTNAWIQTGLGVAIA